MEGQGEVNRDTGRREGRGNCGWKVKYIKNTKILRNTLRIIRKILDH